MSTGSEVTVVVERGRLVIGLGPGHTRAELLAIIATVPLPFAAPSGSTAAGWAARTSPIDSIEAVHSSLRCLNEAGHRARLAPDLGNAGGRTVLLLRIEDADAATAALHWDIELELEQLTAVGIPSVATDGDYVVVVGLVEPVPAADFSPSPSPTPATAV